MKSIIQGTGGVRKKGTRVAGKPSSMRTARKTAIGKQKVKSILVPTDFSHLSKNVIRYASDLAEEFGARITLLHVIEPPPSYLKEYPAPLGRDQITGETKRLLESCAAREIKKELLKTTVVRFGKPYDEIVNAARSMKVDMIIIGTHGTGRNRQEFVGSTAEKVVRYAQCPVITIRE